MQATLSLVATHRLPLLLFTNLDLILTAIISKNSRYIVVALVRLILAVLLHGIHCEKTVFKTFASILSIHMRLLGNFREIDATMWCKRLLNSWIIWVIQTIIRLYIFCIVQCIVSLLNILL